MANFACKMARFETEILSQEENLGSLAELNSEWDRTCSSSHRECVPTSTRMDFLMSKEGVMKRTKTTLFIMSFVVAMLLLAVPRSAMADDWTIFNFRFPAWAENPDTGDFVRLVWGGVVNDTEGTSNVGGTYWHVDADGNVIARGQWRATGERLRAFVRLSDPVPITTVEPHFSGGVVRLDADFSPPLDGQTTHGVTQYCRFRTPVGGALVTRLTELVTDPELGEYLAASQDFTDRAELFFGRSFPLLLPEGVTVGDFTITFVDLPEVITDADDFDPDFFGVSPNALFEHGVGSPDLDDPEVSDGHPLDLLPDGDGVPGTPLTVSQAAGNDITLSWGASCVASDTDYAIYEGLLGDFTSHTQVGSPPCTTGGATTTTITPGTGSRYYLVVPQNATNEGSYGTDSNGLERPPAIGIGACLPQAITACP